MTLVSFVGRVAAAPAFVGGGGYDYSEGPGGQRTRSAMAIVGAEDIRVSASLALLRYSDAQTGNGTGYILGIGVPLMPASWLHVWGSRFVGDETGNPPEGRVRSWRIKAGPNVEFAAGVTAGLYYTRAEDNGGLRSDAASAELTKLFGPSLTGRLGAAYATASDGVHATQGTVGLGYAPVRGVEFSAEGGLARNAALLSASGAIRRPMLPILGSEPGGGDSQASSSAPVFLLGVRVILPG
jgi:hypothetical protein